ncbi:C-5 cytosine-specific DNA methylase [Rhizoclosmatium sp. JEL0117]|nr:C-5 cytosine-specific DNA methylase [Rhizoclosmatium sp. JEL0117]
MQSVLELYSGLGGHHAAYCLVKGFKTGKEASAVKFHAYDVNDNANECYANNFPDAPSSKDISLLKASDFDSIGASLWVMSPPCQPYTRNGSRLNSKDARAHSFINLLQEISLMAAPPTHILLENVLGFETSDSFALLCETLQPRYTLQGYIINPNQCGTPNSRPRFYLLAKGKELSFKCVANNGKFNNGPGIGIGMPVVEPNSVSDYLDLKANDDETLFITHRRLWKAAEQYDILRPSHRRSCCFTKGYGKFARGTGSILSMATDEDIIAAAEKYGFDGSKQGGWEVVDGCHLAQVNWDGVASIRVIRAMKWLFMKYFELRSKHKPKEDAEDEGKESGAKPKRLSAKRKRELDMERGSWPDKLESCPLAALKLRYFSVKEVSRLQGFPDWFEFPTTLTTEQGWKLLGNSINVEIVRGLLLYLLSDE